MIVTKKSRNLDQFLVPKILGTYLYHPVIYELNKNALRGYFKKVVIILGIFMAKYVIWLFTIIVHSFSVFVTALKFYIALHIHILN